MVTGFNEAYVAAWRQPAGPLDLLSQDNARLTSGRFGAHEIRGSEPVSSGFGAIDVVKVLFARRER
jgi:hypothetical protein